MGSTDMVSKMLIVGDGPVARALSTAFEREGLKPQRWWRRQNAALPSCQVALLAVRDSALAEVAAQLGAAAASPPIVLHTAGALSAHQPFAGLTVKPRACALFHPMRAISGLAADADFRGSTFAVQGDDEACKIALLLVEKLGAQALMLPDTTDAHARYHAACALTANHTLGLVARAMELLASTGVDRGIGRSALAQLFLSSARNLQVQGLPAALTGPISRGDFETVEKHLRALGATETAALYRITAKSLVELARQKGQADEQSLARIESLIDAE